MRSLKEFAAFVREHHLEAAAAENLRIAQEMNFPLMRLFAHLPDEQLFAMSCAGLRDFLTFLIDGTALEKAEESMRLWELDELPGISRNSVDVSDLVYVYTAQKRALIRFLPLFTEKTSESVSVINELDTYYSKVQDMAFHLHVKIHAEELRLKNEELIRSNADLEQFAYVSSHDLQEPLRKIRAFGDRLAHKFRDVLGDDGIGYIEVMQSAASRMQVLINDLLKFSRLSRDPEKFKQVKLNHIIEECLNDLDITIEQETASIHVSDLPAIDCIPGQMRQLFQNLLSNALKFHKKGESPVVHIDADIRTGRSLPGVSPVLAHHRFCRITVRDHGIGFNEQYLDKIFVVFQRLHGRLEYQGTGIGLAVCKKIVDNHHGFITATSSENEGATFIIILPVRQEYGASEKIDKENQNSHGG
jgi:signal transduction histidine kinase